MQPSLVAREVKDRLLEALGPVWRSTLAGLQAQPLARAEEILFALQLVPEQIRVIREAPSVSEPAVCLVSGPFGSLCADDGSELRDAVAAYIAGTLSAHVEDAADRALRYAAAVNGHGGFLLVVKPETGETKLFLAKAGEDLSQALDLGGIADRVTLH
jgi:hypothetical protein